MTALTAQEQLLLELVNRARLDPAAEAARHNVGLNQFINASSSGFPITADPKQPLAGNNVLTRVAENHTAVVFNKAVQNGAINFDAHNGAGDGSVVARIAAAGYSQNALPFYRPENWSMYWTTGQLSTAAQQQAAIEAMHAGLFYDDPAKNTGEGGGHRLAMLDPNMKEMGAAVQFGQFQGNNTAMAFENFGVTGTQSFLSGAVYNDTVIKDDFYSIGEGVQGVTATVRNAAGTVVGSDSTGSGGGWSVGQPGGTHTVTFSGGGLATSVAATIEGGSQNAKVDLVNGNRIDTSASATLGAGAKDLRLIGMSDINGTGNAADNVITGNKGANILDGKGGNDTLDGGAGIDTAVFSGKSTDYTVSVLSSTKAQLVDTRGIDGSDTILNIEKVRFSDGVFDFASLKTTATPVAGSVTISDISVTEGASGQVFANFVVTRSGGTAPFSVNFATADGTATAASGDYVSKTGRLDFASGVTSQVVSIAINGDKLVEANETFKVKLSAATNGATISRTEATGTIVNDDVAPANSIPVVTGKNVSLATHGSVAASSLFTATDKDGNATIKQYAFWDAGSGGGYFTVNGVKQAAGAWIQVDAAKVGTVKYVAGANLGSEKLYVTAYDGNAWADNGVLTAKTIARSAQDFNGDNISDVLWHNTSTGSVAMWQMNGSKIVSNTTVGTTAKGWQIQDTGDFGGDGKADMLLRSGTNVAMWQMDGTKVAATKTFGTIGTNWKTADVADFNGDGKADILWSNTANQLAIWQMDGMKIAVNKVVGTMGKGWQVQDAADFTGDGKADILLRSGTNVALWQMDGTKVAATKTFGTIAKEWHFAGAGDFTGDGKADILWRHDNGKVAMWQMDGTKIVANKTVGTIGTAWDVADIGDYNRDGQADILWRHDNGKVALWQMDGHLIESNVSVGSAANAWLLV
jgi:hypothetical protein